MIFGSVCSGIEAASVAWHPLGWRAAWLAEIEPFPSAVLAHHYPSVQNLGDMTKIADRVRSGEVVAPDVFCGGTPCQAFSVAGMRKSLDDARGNLSLTFCEIANEIDSARSIRGEQPAIVFWENVPGVLNTKDNAFGCFLAGLAGEDDPLQPPRGKWSNAGCVYGPTRSVAWRTLDAQYFGVAQRRRRVFVVASARPGFYPAQVLFEWDGMRRDSAPSREAGEETAGTLASRTGAGGFPGTDESCSGYLQPVVAVHGSQDPDTLSDMAHTLGRNQGQENAVLSVALRGRDGGATAELGDEVAGCLRASSGGGDKPHVLAPGATVFQERGRADGRSLEIGGDVAYALTAPNGGGRAQERNVLTPTMQVRRLTPAECERLQGFSDNYTAIPWRKKPASECPDGPRYKALGNSWAVPNVAWIGRRIDDAVKRLEHANDNNPAAEAVA